MKKNKIFIYVIILLTLLFFSCSEKEETTSTTISPETTNSQVVETQIEPETTKEEAPKEEPELVPEPVPVIEPEPEIVVVVDEDTFELEDFIDFPAWDVLGEGMDILKNINSSESIEQLQYKLNLSAMTMNRARTAFTNIQDLPEIKGLADYPIQIIDLYIEAAENFSSKKGDPNTLEGLIEADSLLMELIEILEKGGQNE
jgi:hypothetical protein